MLSFAIVSAEGKDLLFSMSDNDTWDILINFANSKDLRGKVFLHWRSRDPKNLAVPDLIPRILPYTEL